MGKLSNATNVNQIFFDYLIKPGDVVVDMTLGKGSDALALLSRTGDKGYLYGFDIQQQAIDMAHAKLAKKQMHNYSLILACHSSITQYIESDVDVVVFNLGYLPGGDKAITTRWETTKKAIEESYKCLKVGGLIFITVYPGHDMGAIESDALLNALKSVDQMICEVLNLAFINQKNYPPYTLIIEKHKEGLSLNEDTNRE